MSDYQPHGPALLQPAPVWQPQPCSPPHAQPPEAQGRVGQQVPWVSLLLAMACTLVIVALFLTPLWLPSWRHRQASARMRRNDVRLGVQRFADAVSCGDFDKAETEAERLLDRS